MAKSCCGGIVAANSARPFTKPVPIFKRPVVKELFSSTPPGAAVLEVGAGYLRNALFLQQQGYRVTVVELAATRTRFIERYECFEKAGGRFVESAQARNGRPMAFRPWGGPFAVAVVTFVIETICVPDARVALLRKCRGMLRPNGSLIIAVRGVADVVTANASGVSCSDGYVTPQKTFIRSYTAQQLTAVLKCAGFRSITLLHAKGTKAPEYLYALATR